MRTPNKHDHRQEVTDDMIRMLEDGPFGMRLGFGAAKTVSHTIIGCHGFKPICPPKGLLSNHTILGLSIRRGSLQNIDVKACAGRRAFRLRIAPSNWWPYSPIHKARRQTDSATLVRPRKEVQDN